MRRILAAFVLLAAGCGGGSATSDDTAARREAAMPVAPRHALRLAVEDIGGLGELGDGRPLPTISGVSPQSRIDPYLTRIARGVTGRRSEVRCWSARQWRPIRVALAAGAMRPGADGRVHLPAEECNRLVAFANRPSDVRGLPRIELAVAFAAFAHDLEHVAGWDDEAVAECRAMQRLDRLAGLLGAPLALARGLAQLYWTQVYPRNPSAYESGECRDRGALDLDRTLDVWP